MATATSNKKSSGSAPNNMMGAVMFRYFPYWPLFLLLIGIFGVTAWAYLKFYATPIYRVTATILIKDEKKGVEDSKSVDEITGGSSKKIVENEIEVISSKALLKDVVKNLALYAPVFEEGYLRPTSAYVTSPIAIEAKEPDDVVLQKKVYFSFNESTNTVQIGKASYPINQWVTTPFGDLRFRPNEKKAGNATKPLYFSLMFPATAVSGIAGDIHVGANNKLSSVISITLDDEVRRRGKDVLNELLRVYNESAINDKNTLAKNTLAFLDTRIKLVEKQIDSIESGIQKFKSTKGVIDLSEQGKSLMQNSGTNDQKLTDMNTQLMVLDEVEKYVVSKDNKTGIVPATLGVNDPVLSSLLDKLYTAEINFDKLKRTTAENNPILSSVANEIDKIRPNILETIRSQRRNLDASIKNLSATNNNYVSMLSTIPEKERELFEISRQKETKNKLFDFLLAKREETQLKYAGTVSDSRIVDSAEASINPVAPKKPVIYIAAIVFALLIGVGYVSGREFLTNKITFRSEIEDFTSVPVISEITHVSKKNLFVRKSKKLAKIAVAEQFRQLRMALRLYRKQSSKRRLMITSSIGGEGKSFVSSNLAKSLASSGKKVVLIDFDMRNPKTSSLFNLTDKSGIKEFLENEKQVEDVVQNTDHENLYVIPAGEPAINPTELLLGSRLGELFTFLDNGFDYIIADTAPIQPVTDAYIISEFCDTTLFVVRHKYTPKAMIQLLDENNKIKALKNLSIVFNGIRMRGFMSKNIGYGYGYGYGYEYGYADRKYMDKSGKEG